MPFIFESVWLPVLALLGVGAISRWSSGSWHAPGAFFPVVWVVLISICLIGAPDYPVTVFPLWWVVLSFTSFALPGLLFDATERRPAASKRTEPETTPLLLPWLRPLLLVSVAAEIAYIALFDRFVSNISYDRPPLFIQPFLACHYFAPLLGGVQLAAARSKRERVMGLLPAVPPLLLAFSLGGRSAIVWVLTFYLAGYFPIEVLKSRGRASLFSVARVTGGILMLVGILGLAVLHTQAKSVTQTSEGAPFAVRVAAAVEAVRNGGSDESWRIFRHGAFGHIYALTHWFDEAWNNSTPPRWGMITFAGPAELVGLTERGPFEGFEIEPGIVTNVYTFFRPVIEDFTFSGSLLAFAIFGALSAAAYRKTRDGSLTWAAGLAVFYMYAMSLGGHIFVNNTNALAFGMLAAYFLTAERRWRRLAAGRAGNLARAVADA